MSVRTLSTIAFRLTAAYLFIDHMPDLIYRLARIAGGHGSIGASLGEFAYYGTLAVLCAALWFCAPAISRMIPDSPIAGSDSIDSKRFITIGLYGMALLFVYNGVNGVMHALISNLSDSYIGWVTEVFRRYYGMPIQLILGIVLLFVAPRLGAYFGERCGNE